MRVDGGVKILERPFVVIDALAHVTFRFEMEHRRLRLFQPTRKQTSTVCLFLFLQKNSEGRKKGVHHLLNESGPRVEAEVSRRRSHAWRASIA